jgi:hypothetical protein
MKEAWSRMNKMYVRQSAGHAYLWTCCSTVKSSSSSEGDVAKSRPVSLACTLVITSRALEWKGGQREGRRTERREENRGKGGRGQRSGRKRTKSSEEKRKNAGHGSCGK